MKKELGGLRLLEENTVRRKGGVDFLQSKGRFKGGFVENFEEMGLVGERPFFLCGGGWKEDKVLE